jgi:hypothetical protein
MNIFAFIFIAGLIVKGIFILIETLIYKVSLQYDSQSILAVEEAPADSSLETKAVMKMEVVSNSLKPVGKQIYMRTVSQATCK